MKRFQHILTIIAVLTVLLCCLSVTVFADEPIDAIPLTLGTSVDGTHISGSSGVWYSFTLPEDGFLSFCYTPKTGTGTGDITFYTKNKETLFSSILNGLYTQGCRSADYYMEAGEYFCHLTSTSYSDHTFSLTLNYNAPQNQEYESNDSFTSANNIDLDIYCGGRISSSTDADYYRITVPKAGCLNVSIWTYPTNTSCSISLYSASEGTDHNIKQELTQNTPAGFSLNTHARYIGVTPGEYYVVVKSNGETTPYALRIDLTAANNYERLNNNTKETAQKVSTGTYYNGFVSSETDEDWYAFYIPENGSFSIPFYHANVGYNSMYQNHWILMVYDSAGTLIGYDDSRALDDAQIKPTHVTSGTYYLVVKAGNNNYHKGWYRFTVNYPYSSTESSFYCEDISLEHNWEEWHYADPNAAGLLDKEERICSRCKTTQSHWLSDHDHYFTINEPTCTEDGYLQFHCSDGWSNISKDDIIAATNHKWDDGKVTKEPTVEAEGEMTFTCTKCKETKTQPIDKLPDNPFTDVSESDWYFAPVMWAKEAGVTGGTSATTFGPNDGCTRAQVVTFLWAANGKPEPKSMDNPFKDVPNDAWYVKPVLWAVEQGITGGVAEGKFGPDQTCTRAQIATFLYAAKGKPAVSGTSPFDDVADTDWYAKPVVWAKENEVTGGISATQFGPNQVCTRAQVVTFLYKVYG